MVTPRRALFDSHFARGLLLTMAAQTSGRIAVRLQRLLEYRVKAAN
jgi:hypothetical protein